MSCGMTHPFVLTNNKSWDCIEARVTYMRTQFMLAKKAHQRWANLDILVGVLQEL